MRWVDMLPQLKIPDGAAIGDIVVPNAYTAQYNSLLTLLLSRNKKVIRRSFLFGRLAPAHSKRDCGCLQVAV